MPDVLIIVLLWCGAGAVGWIASVALRVHRPDAAEWWGALFPGALVGPLSLLIFYRAVVEAMRPYQRPWFAKRR